MGRGAVLIVEANPGALMVARNVLAREGYTIYTAADPDAGIARCQRDLPDLLLLDAAYAWPDVLTDFANVSPLRLPVVVLVPTGMTDLILDDLREEGATEIVGAIEKPFAPDQLIGCVEESLLDHKNTRPLEITVAASNKNEGVTLQETLDAEIACEMLGVRPAVEVVSLHDPEALSAIQELRSALESKSGASPRARRVAESIRGQAPSSGKAEWFDGAALDQAVQHALDSEERRGRANVVDQDALMTGRIGDVEVADLLQFAAGVRGAVLCTLEDGHRQIDVSLDDRKIVAARQHNLPERFRLGRFLVDMGFIDRPTLDRLIHDGKAHEPLGERLRRIGLARTEDVENALTRQLEEIVCDALVWSTGRFSIRRFDPSAPQPIRPMALRVSAVLLEGMRRQDEWAERAEATGIEKTTVDHQIR